MTRRKRAVLEERYWNWPSPTRQESTSARPATLSPCRRTGTTNRDDEPVREFKSFTDDLNALADWLRRCDVDTVAMKSTGIYWIPLFELLESRGFTVYRQRVMHHLTKRAEKLGFQLTPIPEAA